jgi:hypothetical protein
MKLFKITALALCLNMPMAHAGCEMSTGITTPAQVAGATTVIAATGYSVFKVYQYYPTENTTPSLSRLLILFGSLLAIDGASDIALNTLHCPAILEDYNVKPAVVTAVGLGLIATGKYLENK